MSNPQAHFRALIRLALKDQNFAEIEKDRKVSSVWCDSVVSIEDRRCEKFVLT